MADNFDQTGVIQVDGAWATSVKYSAEAMGPNVGRVELRFLQGRAEVGRVAIARENLGELLGEKNGQAIERHIANDEDKYLAVVSGELRGQGLQYQQVTLKKPDASRTENSVRSEQGGDPVTARASEPTEGGAKNVGGARDHSSSDREVEAERKRRANNAQVAARMTSITTVPAHIAAKYLVKDNTYHFDDQTVAFVDKGTSLTVQTHNKAILADLIAIAQARNWQAVTVSGSEAFRREAWKAAESAGLAVRGYTPSAIERAAAERAGERRAASASAENTSREPTLVGRRDGESERQSTNPVRSEKEAVTATQEGSSTGLGGQKLTRDQEAAAAIRSATITREELQLKYPELNRAVFQHLASHDQFADAYVKSGLIRESDRAQVIAQMRDRLADKLEKGTRIREPDNKEVSTLIRRSVNRVAADIGRTPVEIRSRTPEPMKAPATREDVQVRA